MDAINCASYRQNTVKVEAHMTQEHEIDLVEEALKSPVADAAFELDTKPSWPDREQGLKESQVKEYLAYACQVMRELDGE
jgi:hypothetical protein